MKVPASAMKTTPVAVSYAELHAHSAFSFHDGASQPHELAAAAANLGYAAFALTDHDGVYGIDGVRPGLQAAGRQADPRRRADARRRSSPDAAGQRAAPAGTVSAACLRSPTRTRAITTPRVPSTSRRSRSQTCSNTPHGLICLSGCAQRGAVAGRVDRGEAGVAEAVARRLLQAFGEDDFRIELQRPFARHDRARNHELAQIARRLKVPTVATGNVHVHYRARAPLQDVFVALANNATLDETEPLRRGNSSHVLVAPQEMARRFSDPRAGEHARAVAESAYIADRIDFDITSDLGYRYPGSEDPAMSRRLREVCEAHLHERHGRALRRRPRRHPRRPGGTYARQRRPPPRHYGRGPRPPGRTNSR